MTDIEIICTDLLATRTESDLAATWREVAPTVARMDADLQIRALITFTTRMCVLYGDNGK